MLRKIKKWKEFLLHEKQSPSYCWLTTKNSTKFSQGHHVSAFLG